jgi:hypothetical protein
MQLIALTLMVAVAEIQFIFEPFLILFFLMYFLAYIVVVYNIFVPKQILNRFKTLHHFVSWNIFSLIFNFFINISQYKLIYYLRIHSVFFLFNGQWLKHKILILSVLNQRGKSFLHKENTDFWDVINNLGPYVWIPEPYLLLPLFWFVFVPSQQILM